MAKKRAKWTEEQRAKLRRTLAVKRAAETLKSEIVPRSNRDFIPVRRETLVLLLSETLRFMLKD